MSEMLKARHKRALTNGSATLLKSTDLFFRMKPKQVRYLWRKVSRHVVHDDNGLQDPAMTCWVLPPLVKKTEYTRKHTGVKERRGPYTKADYSFSGQYAQTTFNKKENKSLGLADEDFPTTRTFQATHLALVSRDQRPPAVGWQLHNASHLCGRSDCIRPSHLLWERLDLNYARRMCHVYGADEECPHTPKCILRVPYEHYLSEATSAQENAAEGDLP